MKEHFSAAADKVEGGGWAFLFGHHAHIVLKFSSGKTPKFKSTRCYSFTRS